MLHDLNIHNIHFMFPLVTRNLDLPRNFKNEPGGQVLRRTPGQATPGRPQTSRASMTLLYDVAGAGRPHGIINIFYAGP